MIGKELRNSLAAAFLTGAIVGCCLAIAILLLL